MPQSEVGKEISGIQIRTLRRAGGLLCRASTPEVAVLCVAPRGAEQPAASGGSGH
ncbi:MAG: hypothetical protein ACLVJH_03765 [Faecalibacterium prausnitzii]